MEEILDRDGFMRRNDIGAFDLEILGLRWDEISEIYRDHNAKLDELRDVSDALQRLLAKAPSAHSIRARVKDSEHLVSKIVRKKRTQPGRVIQLKNYREEVTDLIGLRVLHLLKSDWKPIHEYILATFDQNESPPVAYVSAGDSPALFEMYRANGLKVSVHPDGYHSVHYVVKFPYAKTTHLAEVQVRTLIEEAWSEVDHTIRYPQKPSSILMKDYLKMFSRVAASADEMGSFVMGYEQRLQNVGEEPEEYSGLELKDMSRLAQILNVDTKAVEEVSVLGLGESQSFAGPSTKSAEKDEYRVNRSRATAVMRSENLDRAVLQQYYKSQESGLSRYQIVLGEFERDTSIFTSSQRIGLDLLTRDLDIELVDKEFRQAAHPKSALGLRTLRYLISDKARMWNAPMYRLCEATFDGPFRLRFARSDYFTFRFRAGLLEDEIVDSLMQSSNVPSDAVKTLTARNQFLPAGSLADFENRECHGGIAVLCAFARAEFDDFCILLHVRSRRVADGRGLLSVVPKAAHQPGVNDPVEVRIYWTVLREIYEELFSGASAEYNPARAKVDWYCDDSPAVRALHYQEFGSTIKTTGLSVDALNGNYFVSNLVNVPDPKYWDEYGGAIQAMWEQDRGFIVLSSRDSQTVSRLIRNGFWSNDALFTFVEGLLRLKEEYPAKVELGGLSRRLLS